jgi:hypothetical protein
LAMQLHWLSLQRLFRILLMKLHGQLTVRLDRLLMVLMTVRWCRLTSARYCGLGSVRPGLHMVVQTDLLPSRWLHMDNAKAYCKWLCTNGSLSSRRRRSDGNGGRHESRESRGCNGCYGSCQNR